MDRINEETAESIVDTVERYGSRGNHEVVVDEWGRYGGTEPDIEIKLDTVAFTDIANIVRGFRGLTDVTLDYIDTTEGQILVGVNYHGADPEGVAFTEDL